MDAEHQVNRSLRSLTEDVTQMRGRMKGLEAHHQLDDPLDEAMILLDDVVQVFDLPDFMERPP